MDIRWLVVVLIFIWLTGCAHLPEQQASSVYQRGWLYEEAGSEQNELTYRPCFARHTTVVTSTPSTLRRFKSQFTGPLPVYVEWLGNPSLNATDISLGELRYLSVDPDSCAVELKDILLRAHGTQRNWTVDIYENEIQVLLNDLRQQFTFPLNTPLRQGNEWTWEADMQVSTGETHRMELKVSPGSCTVSNDWYRLSANLLVNGRTYRGCARRGMLDRAMIFTQYSFPYYVSTRAFDLHLSPNGDAFLREDYQGIQPVVESSGSWSIMPGRRLMVQFAYNQDMLRQEVLLFKLGEDGAIVMEQGHSRYGPLGIELVPTGSTMPLEVRLRHLVP